jgi:hypothetical protein
MSMKLITIAALLVLVARPAQAQRLTIASTVFVTAASADWISTVAALHAGGVERNPSLAWAGSPTRIVLVGASQDALGLWAATKWFGPHHPRLLAVALYASSAYRFAIVHHNTQSIQTMGR